MVNSPLSRSIADRSAPRRVRTFSISKNLGVEFRTEVDQGVYLILKDCKALARSQRQRPAYQREIDSIVTILADHEFRLLRYRDGAVGAG